MDFVKITKQLWTYYLSNDEVESRRAFDWMADHSVIIGTGAHEFYVGLSLFADAWLKEVRERRDVVFQFKNFWCQQRELYPDLFLVYGTMHIWWESADQSTSIDMDCRFSILYQQLNGVWKIVHLHQSTPNADQMEGEYYPKTLHQQILQTNKLVEHMTDLAMRDGLTGLTNFRGLEDVWNSWDQPKSWIFVIDLDDFKGVNDTYGHMAGNEVLKRVSRTLLETMRSCDVVCRLGGDEFVVLCQGLQEKSEAHLVAQRIMTQLNVDTENFPYPVQISMGGTGIQPDESLEQAIERADQGLYRIKKTTKNGYKLI